MNIPTLDAVLSQAQATKIPGAAEDGGDGPPRAAAKAVPRTEQITLALARLALAHERSIQDLEHRITCIIVVRALADKQEIETIRKNWKEKLDPDKKGHPWGCSQRALVFAKILELLG